MPRHLEGTTAASASMRSGRSGRSEYFDVVGGQIDVDRAPASGGTLLSLTRPEVLIPLRILHVPAPAFVAAVDTAARPRESRGGAG
jgi:hypothetical protein